MLDILGVSLEQVRTQVMRVLRQGQAAAWTAIGQRRRSGAQRQSKTPYLDALGVDLTEWPRPGGSTR